MSNLPGSTVNAIALGQVLDDKYQLLDVLGVGAMGTVYSAWHMGLEQRVAIKLLRSEDPEYDTVARQRFQREARAAARIQSEHVCRVLDTGNLSDGTPYLVMEHLEGCDMASELLKHERVPVAEAVRYVRETCAAVAEAHRVGIVHRDLKPANLFLHHRSDGQRTIKILDFGVSKSTANNVSLTRTSALVGSPIYMSPEQIKSSRDVDGRTDLWALGAILFELLSGRPPFDEDNIAQLVNAVLYRETPSLRARGIDVPEALDAAIQKALHKECAERFQTAEELSLALAPFDPSFDAARSSLTGAGLTLSTTRMVVPRSQPPAVLAQTTSSKSHPGDVARPSSLPAPQSSRPGWLVPAALAGALGVGLAVALAVVQTTHAPQARPAPSLPTLVLPPQAPAVIAPTQAEEPLPSVAQDAAALLPEPEPALERPAAEPPRHDSERRRPRRDPAPAATVGAPIQPAGEPDLPNFGGRR